ncbi:hypothetical protein ACVME8_004972 [Bradyrhizobium diazoefficiens]
MISAERVPAAAVELDLARQVCRRGHSRFVGGETALLRNCGQRRLTFFDRIVGDTPIGQIEIGDPDDQRQRQSGDPQRDLGDDREHQRAPLRGYAVALQEFGELLPESRDEYADRRGERRERFDPGDGDAADRPADRVAVDDIEHLQQHEGLELEERDHGKQHQEGRAGGRPMRAKLLAVLGTCKRLLERPTEEQADADDRRCQRQREIPDLKDAGEVTRDAEQECDARGIGQEDGRADAPLRA